MSNTVEPTPKKGVIGFFRDCRVELGKITWPNFHELMGSTWVVAALIFLLSAFVFVSDRILSVVMGWLTQIG